MSAFGKQTPGALYYHRSLGCAAPEKIQAVVGLARMALSRYVPWNVIKVSNDRRYVSFLFYPEFDTEDHPALRAAQRVDTRSLKVTVTNYWRDNPFILHRKDSLVGPEYPKYAEFRACTQREEALGLLSRKDIGTRRGWLAALSACDPQNTP